MTLSSPAVCLQHPKKAVSCHAVPCCAPCQVYAWFLGTYKVSVFVGMCGYFLLVLDMFGVGLLLARYVEPGGWPHMTLAWRHVRQGLAPLGAALVLVHMLASAVWMVDDYFCQAVTSMFEVAVVTASRQLSALHQLWAPLTVECASFHPTDRACLLASSLFVHMCRLVIDTTVVWSVFWHPGQGPG